MRTPQPALVPTPQPALDWPVLGVGTITRASAIILVRVCNYTLTVCQHQFPVGIASMLLQIEAWRHGIAAADIVQVWGISHYSQSLLSTVTTNYISLTPTTGHSPPQQVTRPHYRSLTLTTGHSPPLQLTHTHYMSLTPSTSHSPPLKATHPHYRSLTPTTCHVKHSYLNTQPYTHT